MSSGDKNWDVKMAEYNRPERETVNQTAQALAIAQDNADTARKALEQRDELARALREVLDGLGAIGKPWELQGFGISARRAEEICGLVE